MAKYSFVTDPGHGWLSVPLQDIQQLGIADRISRYSYMTDKRAYLEEDCDAGVFLEAARIDPKSIPNTYSDKAKCRSYASYDARWVHNPFKVGRAIYVGDLDHRARGVVTGLVRGRYIVEAATQLPNGETWTVKYGLPTGNPLNYCSPAD